MKRDGNREKTGGKEPCPQLCQRGVGGFQSFKFKKRLRKGGERCIDLVFGHVLLLLVDICPKNSSAIISC